MEIEFESQDKQIENWGSWGKDEEKEEEEEEVTF